MYEIGLQMYSIRTVEGTLLQRLQKTAAMGFDGVEFAGMEGYSAQQLKQALDENGLACMGTHTNIDLLRKDLNGQIRLHHILEAPYITVPGARPELPSGAGDAETVDAWKRLAEELNGIGREIAAEGMKFCYHNHSAEFMPIGNSGTCPEDILFTCTDPDYVRCELDTCWIENTGRMSVDFMTQYASAMELLHIKELTAPGDPTAKIIGQGCIDFPSVIQKGKEVGVKKLIIEHEGLDGNILGDIEAGLRYLRTIC